jgi:GDP-D-mannose 3',5'-epimerase
MKIARSSRKRYLRRLHIWEKRILVTGAGGFIGHHLVKRLELDGHRVWGVDIKYPEYEATSSDAFEILDLRKAENCLLATARRDR